MNFYKQINSFTHITFRGHLSFIQTCVPYVFVTEFNPEYGFVNLIPETYLFYPVISCVRNLARSGGNIDTNATIN